MTPRTFSELLADSMLLLKECFLEWVAILSAGLGAGLAFTAVVLLALGLTDMTLLMAAVARGENGVVLPLLVAGLLDKALGALALVALLRSAAARDEGRDLGVSKAYAEALPRLLPFLWAQARALLGILWGLCRLLWPGLKLCVLYAFVPLTSVVEDARGGDALARSASVAQRDPLKTAGNLAAALGLACAVYALAAFVLTAAMTFPRTAISGGDSLGEAMLLGFVNKLASGLAVAWLSSFSILLYRDLSAGSAAAR